MGKNCPVVDFIIIGAMKAGSTSLADYLSQNQAICMSKPKEPQFFSRNYNSWDINKYESLWEDPLKICGEASTCYSRWPYYKEVPKRIFKYNPEVKLIYILRDPVQRAYSHYRHNILVDRLSYISFNDALSKTDEIVMSSKYMLQLCQFLEYFPVEQVLLIDFDKMLQNSQATVNKVETFIGAPLTNRNGLNDICSNQAGSVLAYKNVRNQLDRVRNFPIVKDIVNNSLSPKMRGLIRKYIDNCLKESFLIKRLAKLSVERVDKLSDEHINYLYTNLKSDIDALEQFWQYDLSHWKR